MRYYELWFVLLKWKKEFSAKEFAATFRSPSVNKILFDMVGKGFLKKVGWGRYEVTSQEQLFRDRVNVGEAYGVVSQIKLKYAFTEADAVFFWTKGGYQVGRFFGFYPIFLKVLKSDLAKWKKAIKSRHMRFHVGGKKLRETLFGIFYVLMPEKDFKAEKLEGYYVEPLKQTIEFCRKNIYQYEPALEMLNETYKLGMKIRYREI